jgi:hypothetical protein
MNSTFPITDPLVLSFWIFNLALSMSMLGSVVRRSLEMSLVRSDRPEIEQMIKEGRIPLIAKISMYIFKVPAYILCGTAIYITHTLKHGFFLSYALTTAILLWIPFETRPIKGGAPTLNLQCLSERLIWLRVILCVSPLLILVVDSALDGRLSIIAWLPTLLVVVLEYFMFRPQEHRFWLARGIDFGKGEDNGVRIRKHTGEKVDESAPTEVIPVEAIETR